MKRSYWIALGALAAQAASAGVYVEMVDHDIKAGRDRRSRRRSTCRTATAGSWMPKGMPR